MEQFARPWESDAPPKSPYPALIAEGLEALGIGYAAAQLQQWAAHLDTLARFNPRLNLTSLTDPALVVSHLLLDSLLLAPLSEEIRGTRIADVGSGGGFPGLTLAIARPDWEVELLERKTRIAVFLEEAVRLSRTTNVTVLNCALEEYPVGRDREAPLYTSKAVFPLEQFCHLLSAHAPKEAQAAWWGSPGLAVGDLPDGWNLIGHHECDLPLSGRPSAVYLLSRE